MSNSRPVCLALLWALTSSPLAYAGGVVASVLHAFHHEPNDSEGSRPGPVALGADGSLYGTTAAGGISGAGTVFRISLSGRFETLYSFKGPEGLAPESCLLPGADGNFYGIVKRNGNDMGVFRITAVGELTILSVLRPRTAPDDDWSAVIKGSDGRLYSVTNGGDPSFELVRFEADAKGEPAYNTVHAHVGPGGTSPLSASWSERVKAQIHEATPTGRRPSEIRAVLCGNTVVAHDGHLWSSPNYGRGLLRSATDKVELGFYWPIPMYLGRAPSGALTENPDFQAAQGSMGRFAEADDGDVLAVSGRVVANEWRYEVIAVSASGKIERRFPLDILGNRVAPVYGLMRAGDGQFYGLGQGGGDGKSVLYRLNSSGVVDVIYRFAQAGANDRIASPLTVGPDGTLYVTFIGGKDNQDGTIYRITP